MNISAIKKGKKRIFVLYCEKCNEIISKKPKSQHICKEIMGTLTK